MDNYMRERERTTKSVNKNDSTHFFFSTKLLPTLFSCIHGE